MPNIMLSYLYRDAGNYKNYGVVVFANPTNIGLAEIEHHIRKNLIDGCWFYTEEWQLPDLPFPHSSASDPTWHEFESVKYTNKSRYYGFVIVTYRMGIASCLAMTWFRTVGSA